MKRLVEYEFEEGGSITVEVDDEVLPAGVSRAGPRDVAQKAAARFDDALEQVKPVASSVLRKIGEIDARPDDVTVEFGITMGGKAGSFIASVGAEATLKVTLGWGVTPAAPR